VYYVVYMSKKVRFFAITREPLAQFWCNLVCTLNSWHIAWHCCKPQSTVLHMFNEASRHWLVDVFHTIIFWFWCNLVSMHTYTMNLLPGWPWPIFQVHRGQTNFFEGQLQLGRHPCYVCEIAKVSKPYVMLTGESERMGPASYYEI
jgi:hypothetical protein